MLSKVWFIDISSACQSLYDNLRDTKIYNITLFYVFFYSVLCNQLLVRCVDINSHTINIICRNSILGISSTYYNQKRNCSADSQVSFNEVMLHNSCSPVIHIPIYNIYNRYIIVYISPFLLLI